MDQQMATVQGAAMQPSLRNVLGTLSGQVVQGDAFAAIFQQLMGQSEGFDALFAQSTKENNEKGNRMGAEMAADMLAMFPNLSQSQLLFSTFQELRTTQAVSPESELMNGQPVLYTNLMLTEKGETIGLPAKELGNAFGESYTTLRGTWQTQQQTSSFGVRLQESSLREARKLLADTRMGEQVEPLDIESLQAAVDAGRFLPAVNVEQQSSLPLPTTEEIGAQLKDGILENVSKGKNEFIVRLKPEGIGEIVVKLSENKEKIALSIFTSSSQTAKMIANEVETLQNALRPLRAEVQQITVTPSGHAAEYGAQTAMSDQSRQFAEQQFAGRWRQDSTFQSPQDEEHFDDLMNQTLEDDRKLNVYI